MGYYTYYQVSWDKHEEASIDEAIEKKFNEITGIDEEIMGANYDGWTYHNKYYIYFYAKWYDWADDICVLTKTYPDITFEVSGDGEDAEDLWKSVWKDGSYEIQRAVIPPFTGEMKPY